MSVGVDRKGGGANFETDKQKERLLASNYILM